MLVLFADQELEDLFTTGKSRKYNQEIVKGFIKKIITLRNILDEKELLPWKALNFEKLHNYPK
jgi:plasmid maintenance system killer protein